MLKFLKKQQKEGDDTVLNDPIYENVQEQIISYSIPIEKKQILIKQLQELAIFSLKRNNNMRLKSWDNTTHLFEVVSGLKKRKIAIHNLKEDADKIKKALELAGKLEKINTNYTRSNQEFEGTFKISYHGDNQTTNATIMHPVQLEFMNTIKENETTIEDKKKDLTNGTYFKHKSYTPEMITPEIISDAIQHESNKQQLINQKFRSQKTWLVITLNALGEGKDFILLPEKTLKHVYASNFSKVFLFQLNTEQIYPLQIRFKKSGFKT